MNFKSEMDGSEKEIAVSLRVPGDNAGYGGVKASNLRIMKYKALFIDVDGTLLTDDLTISPGTKEALGRCAGLGILVCVVTARPPDASLFIYEELGISQNPIICFNGALILQEGKILHEDTIATTQVESIMEEVKGFTVNTSLYRHRDWFTTHIDRWIHQEEEITNTKVTEINFSQLLSADFQPNKILCMGEPPEINALEIHLKKIEFASLNIHKSKPSYLEIMNKKASKSQGVERVSHAYGVTREEVIAIGDNFNDVDMLLHAGTSIAMGNAPEEVKRCASIVTDTNNREGIQKALNKLIS